MLKKKPEYCPYKEYWFGQSEEAQSKPAGLKFKRGSLLKIQPKGRHLENYEWGESGKRIDCNYDHLLRQGEVVLLLDYDCGFVHRKEFTDVGVNRKWVLSTEHIFTFLLGEKIFTFTLAVWGDFFKNHHNTMWMKARKPRKPPLKKPKKRTPGFSLDPDE